MHNIMYIYIHMYLYIPGQIHTSENSFSDTSLFLAHLAVALKLQHIQLYERDSTTFNVVNLLTCFLSRNGTL